MRVLAIFCAAFAAGVALSQYLLSAQWALILCGVFAAAALVMGLCGCANKRGDWAKRAFLCALGLAFAFGYNTLYGNVKKCAVGKHPKSEKHGNTAQFSEVERSGTQENCGGIGSGCRLRLRPLPVLRRRQSQRVARIDPNAVVVDKNIAENDRFDLFSR